MLNILNTTLKKKEKIKRVKSNNFHVNHSRYLEKCDIHDIRESTFFEKVRVTKIFFESTLYSLEMTVLGEPTDGD